MYYNAIKKVMQETFSFKTMLECICFVSRNLSKPLQNINKKQSAAILNSATIYEKLIACI